MLPMHVFLPAFLGIFYGFFMAFCLPLCTITPTPTSHFMTLTTKNTAFFGSSSLQYAAFSKAK